jgi:hypothetical protein
MSGVKLRHRNHLLPTFTDWQPMNAWIKQAQAAIGNRCEVRSGIVLQVSDDRITAFTWIGYRKNSGVRHES